MTSKADEIRSQIAGLDGMIADEEKEIEARLSSVDAIRVYVDHLYAKRAKLEAQLAREDTVLVKPTGPCVTLEAHDGVEWDV